MEKTEGKWAPVVVQAFQENHQGVPGQIGPVDIVVTTIRNIRGQVSQVTIDRKNSQIPSLFTEYSYDSQGSLVYMANSLYLGESSWKHLVELVDGKSGESQFLVDHDIDFMKDLREPRVGEAVDFSKVIEKARRAKHLALKVIEGSDTSALIHSFTWTTEKGVVYSYSRVWEFDASKGKNILKRTTNVKSLKGVGDNSWHPNALPKIKEFLYDEKGLKGVNVYKGDELYYSDSYGLWFNDKILVNGKPAQVFDVTRTFGEHNREQTGENERYYSFGDLLTKDWPSQLHASAFSARVSDSLPLFVRQPGEENVWVLNRKAGDIFTREIEFPTIPGKKIKVRLEVVDINKAGQPQYRELGFEVV